MLIDLSQKQIDIINEAMNQSVLDGFYDETHDADLRDLQNKGLVGRTKQCSNG